VSTEKYLNKGEKPKMKKFLAVILAMAMVFALAAAASADYTA
jgi:hypothetical protein